MSIEAVLSAHDTPPPSMRSGVPEPKGRAMGSRADVIAALETVFGPLQFGPNGVGGAPVSDDPEAPSLLIDLGREDPCLWIGLSWRGWDDMDDRLARLRAAHPDWYIQHPILGEWDHHL